MVSGQAADTSVPFQEMTVSLLLLSVLFGIALAEIAQSVFGGRWFHSQLHGMGRFMHEFKQSGDDHARQALMLHHGRAMLLFSFALLVIFAVMALIAGFPLWLSEWTDSEQTQYLVAISIVATAWWLFSIYRKRGAQAGDYGRLERWLHWIALESKSVRHLTFDLECKIALPSRLVGGGAFPADRLDPASGAVYVCGLARSGTTMLLRLIHDVDVFRSLTYRDMPFVLSPNLWKKAVGHGGQEQESKERAHGDGIMVDFDSPESFEEVFWRMFEDGSEGGGRCLDAIEPSEEMLEAFADYRALVANPRTERRPQNAPLRRYLSKNNNNLLRLRSLCADKTACVLLVYRHPVEAARSLWRQHQRFCESQRVDRFSRAYMGWLAHYEFGLDHRPFCFAVPEMDARLSPHDINYWLDYWVAVHHYILSLGNLPYCLVDHDVLRTHPQPMLEAIFAHLGVRADAASLAQQVAPPPGKTASIDGLSGDLLQRAELTYRTLQEHSKNIYRPV